MLHNTELNTHYVVNTKYPIYICVKHEALVIKSDTNKIMRVVNFENVII